MQKVGRKQLFFAGADKKRAHESRRCPDALCRQVCALAAGMLGSVGLGGVWLYGSV